MDTGSEPREELTGGVHRVVRVGGTVVRPMGPYSQAVHHVLAHLERVGFVGVPRLIATDIELQTETVSFLEGEVGHAPLPPTFTSDETMRSAARFLRRLHDALATFDIPREVEWWLPPVEPADIVVHGDFAPYNCVVVDGSVTGVFDFDTAHPAHRLWDVGYAGYRWVPLVAPSNPDGFGTLQSQTRRLREFCAASTHFGDVWCVGRRVAPASAPDV